MNKRSEAAIKAWLKLPKDERIGYVDEIRGNIRLCQIEGMYDDGTITSELQIAKFSVASIIAKRLPARKKKGKG